MWSEPALRSQFLKSIKDHHCLWCGTFMDFPFHQNHMPRRQGLWPLLTGDLIVLLCLAKDFIHMIATTYLWRAVAPHGLNTSTSADPQRRNYGKWSAQFAGGSSTARVGSGSDTVYDHLQLCTQVGVSPKTIDWYWYHSSVIGLVHLANGESSMFAEDCGSMEVQPALREEMVKAGSDFGTYGVRITPKPQPIAGSNEQFYSHWLDLHYNWNISIINHPNQSTAWSAVVLWGRANFLSIKGAVSHSLCFNTANTFSGASCEEWIHHHRPQASTHDERPSRISTSGALHFNDHWDGNVVADMKWFQYLIEILDKQSY